MVTEKLFQFFRRIANAIGEGVNDFERALVLADLHKLIDEVLVRLQLAQKLREFLARAFQLLDRALGCASQLAPPLDQELLVLRL